MARRPSRKRSKVDFASLRGLRVRSYVRESTERQAGADHYGHDLQRAGIRQFCEAHQISQAEHEYFDAVSGRSTVGRSGLQRALEEAHGYGVLVFFHSSRSFRNRHDAVIWKRRFRDAGITLVFAQQGIISGNPDHKLQEGLYELIDEQRSDEAGMMISNALRQKHERGGVNGKPPLGYHRYHGEPGDPLNGSLAVDKEGAQTVQRLFALYLEGHSIRSLVSAANAEGLRTRLGRPFSRGAVEEILRNRTYTGASIWSPGTPDEEVIKGAPEAVIDADMFHRVEAARRERRTWTGPKGRTRAARIYPLTRRAFCYHCGGSFFGDTGSRTNKRRMRHAAGSCDYRRSFSSDLLEGQARELVVKRLSLPPASIERIAIAAAKAPEARDSTQAERLQGALEKLRQLFTWGDIEEAEYRKQREDIERALRDAAPRQPIGLNEVQRGIEYLSQLGTMWDSAPLEARREIVNLVFEEVQIGARGIQHVELQEPYRSLLRVGGRIGRGGRI